MIAEFTRPEKREFPPMEWFSTDWQTYRARLPYDARAWSAWYAEQRFMAAFSGALLVSGQHLQEISQQHENARTRRVFRRWAWKHQ